MQTHTSPHERQIPPINDYFTPSQLAEQLGVSERSLARWHVRRIGPPRTRIGGKRIVYSRQAVERWLAARTEPA